MGISFNINSKSKGFYTNPNSVGGNIDVQTLIKTLNRFPVNIQKNVMVGATRAAANVIRDEARRLAPKKTKNLSKSIVSIMRKSKQGEIRFSVTPSRGKPNDGWYAHFVEFGTSKQSAQPFLRPAFESSEKQSLEASKQYIAQRLPKELEKAKK